VQTVLGRVNNLAMLIALLFIVMLAVIPPSMRSRKEQLLMTMLGGLFLYAMLISLHRNGQSIIILGGLVAIFGSISAGLGAYSLGKSGMGVHHRILAFSVLTLPALAVPPILIAWAPDAYPVFWHKVYGYENVRAYGHFAATVAIVLSGLALHSLRARNPAILAVHFIALAFAFSFLFWSGGRAGMVALLLAVVFSWIVMWRSVVSQIPFVFGAAGAGLLLSTLYYTPGRWFGVINRFQETLDNVASGGVAKASHNRIEMWQWAWGKILEEPLLGHGYLPMARIRVEQFNYAHTHNIVIEYLLSFGLFFGSAALLLAFGLWLRAVIAARRIATPASQALLMVTTLLAIYSMFDATLFFPYYLMIFMASIGALIGWDIHRQSPVPEKKAFEARADWMFEDLK